MPPKKLSFLQSLQKRKDDLNAARPDPKLLKGKAAVNPEQKHIVEKNLQEEAEKKQELQIKERFEKEENRLIQQQENLLAQHNDYFAVKIGPNITKKMRELGHIGDDGSVIQRKPDSFGVINAYQVEESVIEKIHKRSTQIQNKQQSDTQTTTNSVISIDDAFDVHKAFDNENLPEFSISAIPENVTQDSIKKKLREVFGVPICYFGESDLQRYKRLKLLERESVSTAQEKDRGSLGAIGQINRFQRNMMGAFGSSDGDSFYDGDNYDAFNEHERRNNKLNAKYSHGGSRLIAMEKIKENEEDSSRSNSPRENRQKKDNDDRDGDMSPTEEESQSEGPLKLLQKSKSKDNVKTTTNDTKTTISSNNTTINKNLPDSDDSTDEDSDSSDEEMYGDNKFLRERWRGSVEREIKHWIKKNFQVWEQKIKWGIKNPQKYLATGVDSLHTKWGNSITTKKDYSMSYFSKNTMCEAELLGIDAAQWKRNQDDEKKRRERNSTKADRFVNGSGFFQIENDYHGDSDDSENDELFKIDKEIEKKRRKKRKIEDSQQNSQQKSVDGVVTSVVTLEDLMPKKASADITMIKDDTITIKDTNTIITSSDQPPSFNQADKINEQHNESVFEGFRARVFEGPLLPGALPIPAPEEDPHVEDVSAINERISNACDDFLKESTEKKQRREAREKKRLAEKKKTKNSNTHTIKSELISNLDQINMKIKLTPIMKREITIYRESLNDIRLLLNRLKAKFDAKNLRYLTEKEIRENKNFADYYSEKLDSKPLMDEHVGFLHEIVQHCNKKEYRTASEKYIMLTVTNKKWAQGLTKIYKRPRGGGSYLMMEWSRNPNDWNSNLYDEANRRYLQVFKRLMKYHCEVQPPDDKAQMLA